MHNFTWIFLATCADPKALPVVLRTQADTEKSARDLLAGDYILTFAAKINTECAFRCGFITDACDDENKAIHWGITASYQDRKEMMEWVHNRAWEKEVRAEMAKRGWEDAHHA
ncbi:TPA: host cell division inhibitor Icd-like protein [Salmonella enterica subsp. diarizonae]